LTFVKIITQDSDHHKPDNLHHFWRYLHKLPNGNLLGPFPSYKYRFDGFKAGTRDFGGVVRRDGQAENFHLDIYANNPKNDANYQVYVRQNRVNCLAK